MNGKRRDVRSETDGAYDVKVIYGTSVIKRKERASKRDDGEEE